MGESSRYDSANKIAEYVRKEDFDNKENCGSNPSWSHKTNRDLISCVDIEEGINGQTSDDQVCEIKKI